MAVQESITPAHVNEAFALIRTKGIPDKAQSTKFDVIDPETGERFPPKLVLSIASGLSGVPLSRKDFSGGDRTNPRLQALGFEIVGKDQPVVRKIALTHLQVGEHVTNDELVFTFAVGNAGGIRYSSAHSCLVIIADHTKGLYDDRWDGDILLYTGMGSTGDQRLEGQNRRVAEQPETKMPIHLFEVFTKNRYEYRGEVRLVSKAYQDQQLDQNGLLRKVYIFPLRLVSENTKVLPPEKSLRNLADQRRRSLRKKSIEGCCQTNCTLTFSG